MSAPVLDRQAFQPVTCSHLWWQGGENVEDPYLDTQGVAELTGLSVLTVRNHIKRSRKNREDGSIRPGDMPPPDETFGQSPVWKKSTILLWRSNMPGRGVGGGPKPRRRPE